MASRKRALLAPTDDLQQLQFRLDSLERLCYELIRPEEGLNIAELSVLTNGRMAQMLFTFSDE